MIKLIPPHNIPEAKLDAAAKAIAWLELSSKGRAECKWPKSFAPSEIDGFRAQAAVAILAAFPDWA